MQTYKEFITNKNLKSDLGRALDVQKFAVHWITLKAKQTSSNPHAESLEEEFVYVAKGEPHVWINGYIYQLAVGDAVGFKSGTGIAHCFINNNAEDIELIVLGEKTKPENKCSFPVNPELYEEHQKIWWADYPEQTFGPHDGLVGNLNHLKPKSECALIKSVYNEKRKTGFSYPGDTETFGEGLRLTDFVDLKILGVWHEILKPGFRSSWPHSHLVEAEFAVILKGHPQVWLNGFIYDLNPGDGVYFKPGTNIAHTILNSTNENVEYLSIGEADGADPDDKVFYPLHPQRNEECLKNGDGWKNPPTKEFGTHNGQAKK